MRVVEFNDYIKALHMDANRSHDSHASRSDFKLGSLADMAELAA